MHKIIPILFLLTSILIACGDKDGNPLSDASEPTKPTELKAELQPTAILLTWKKSEHAATYRLFRKSGEGEASVIGTPTDPKFIDTAVVDGTQYDYWVQGFGSGDEKGPGLAGSPSDRISQTFHKPGLELVDTPNTTLDFGIDRSDTTIFFKNRGGGELRWTIADEADWLRFEPSEGTVDNKNQANVTVKIDRVRLDPGRYEATASLTGQLGGTSPLTTEPIVLTIKVEIRSEPVLAVDTESVTLCPGESTEIKVSNSGKGTLRWQLAGKPAWLDVTPTDGSLEAGEAVPVKLQALESGTRSAEELQGEVRFTGASQEKSVVVTRHGETAEVEISPNRLTLVDGVNVANFTLRNTGGCDLTWGAVTPQNWLTVAPDSGRLKPNESQPIRVSRATAVQSLNAGTHNAVIRFPFAERQPEVAVTLTRVGRLRGRCINVYTGRGVPNVTVVVTGVGQGRTDSNGDFEIPYNREGTYNWRVNSPDFLSRNGRITTNRAVGEIGTLALIPIPKPAGEVSTNFRFDTPWSIALNDDGRQACIVNRDGGFVSLVDTRVNKETARLETGNTPLGAVYADDELFVANSGDNTISVIDPRQNRELRKINVSGQPAYLGACGGKLYVTLQDNIGGNQVAVIDIDTRREEQRIPVGKLPVGVVTDLTCRTLFVANHDDNQLSWVELGGVRNIKLGVGPTPQGVAVSPDGRFVYTADAGRISRIDVQRQVIADPLVQAGARFGWVAVAQLPNNAGDLVYATDERGNQIWVWHPESGGSAPINVGARPFGVSVTEDGRGVYVCNAEGNTVQWLESQ